MAVAGLVGLQRDGKKARIRTVGAQIYRLCAKRERYSEYK